ncbi:hypothetical protein C8J57DRAFT_1727351 [Mycena rebaudengoi]|nr:hypothetical protein C8J57DRAFT_1727351 [Mycena rebaudengoi]
MPYVITVVVLPPRIHVDEAAVLVKQRLAGSREPARATRAAPTLRTQSAPTDRYDEFKIDDIPEEKEEKASTSKGNTAPKPKSDVFLQDQPPTRSGRNASKDPQPDSGSYHSTSETQKSKRAGDVLEPPVAAKKPRKAVEPKLQCASYALELLLNGGLRSHVIGVLVLFHSLELLYYDRSIVVKSQPLRFTKPENRATFLAVLSAFGPLRKPQWGYPELLNPPARNPLPLPIKPTSEFWRGMYRDRVLELKGGWKLVSGDIIFRAHGVIGRGMVVVRATVEGHLCH